MEKAYLKAIFVLLMVATSFAFGCQPGNSSGKTRNNSDAQVMVVSLSTDGRYALSSHLNNTLVLWDLQKKTKATISSQSNIYSAYFIKGTDKFLWQNSNGTVHVQDIAGNTIKTFPHFPTYGHVMSPDLQTYFSSDQNWNVFFGYGEMKAVKRDGDSPSFFVGKLLNFSLSKDGRILLSAGDGSSLADSEPIEKYPPINPEQRFSNYAGVVLWDAKTQNPIAKLAGNAAKTHATMSPDGKHIVSGCENGLGFVWNVSAPHNEPMVVGHPGLGVLTEKGWDNTGGIDLPLDFDGGHHSGILGQFFIDTVHYVRIYTYEPYAFLYHVDNPLPLKYLPLGRDPFPAVSDYSRNVAIDTAPDAGVLVMGQRAGSGIIVYQYHPEKQELEKVWAGN